MYKSYELKDIVIRTITGNRTVIDKGLEVEVEGKKHRLMKFDKFMSCDDCSLVSYCYPGDEPCYICGENGASRIFIPKEVMNDNDILNNYLKNLKSWKLSQK